jgi:hypothetical protein
MASCSDSARDIAIGGVFSLGSGTDPATGRSVFARWTEDAGAVHCFHNARSALHHVLVSHAPTRIWLPAYLCPEVVSAIPASIEIRYYGLDEALAPDVRLLREELRSDDAILGAHLFGKPLPAEWRGLASEWPELLWIEDCAQALDIGDAHFAPIRIYSPRKLLGAPDGGILVDGEGVLPPPNLAPCTDEKFVRPYALRAADRNDEDNARWFRAFRQAEASMEVGPKAMSDTALRIVKSAAIQPIAEKRIRNYRALVERLADHALIAEIPDRWAPVGFPIIAKDSAALGAFLADRKIYAPRHWAELPSPRADFPGEHRLAHMQLTIPCDQRYDEQDMERAATTVLEFFS